MSLTFAYAQARSALYEALAAKGCMDVEKVLEQHGLQWPDLESSGLLEQKPLQSTAEMLEYQPTAAGRKLLTYYSSYDVMVVKEGKVQALLAAVRG